MRGYVLLSLALSIAALKASAQNVQALLSQGNQFYRSGQYDLAEQQYRKALASDPANATAAFNLSNALQKQRKFDEALKLLQPLSEEVKDGGLKELIHYNTGVAHSSLKELEASIEAYKSALRLNPDDTQARENLQKALLELKKQKEQQQNQQRQNQQQPKMNQKEAEQKLKLLQQKEKNIQERLKSQSGQKGSMQGKDW
jgi:Ca-activated chloride channel homolog